MKGSIDIKVWIALGLAILLFLIAGAYVIYNYKTFSLSPERQTAGCIRICDSSTDSEADLRFLRCVPQIIPQQQSGDNICSASCTGFLNDQSDNPGQTAPAGTACALVDCFCE